MTSATNYTITGIPVGSFTIGVVVTNAYGTNSSTVAFNSIAAPPSITVNPTSATRFTGYPFSFSVTAGGSQPLTYFWKQGTTVVQAGTSSSYSGTASPGTAGTYTVVVSNETLTTVTSTPAILTVNPVPPGYGSNVLNSAPISYWRLDENSGTVAHDGIAGNDGIFNATTLGVPGYSVVDSDTAASFSGVNSYVGNINGAGSLNFPGHSVFSLECWVNAPAGQNDEASIIAKGIGNVGTTRTEQFSLDVAGGAYRFFTTHGNTIYEADATDGPNGTWQHIVCVYDDQNILGGGSNMYIYVNGQLQGQHATAPTFGVNSTVSFVSFGSKHLGNDPNNDGTFNGTVDEVAIYNTALSSATVQAHYAAAYGSALPP